MGDRAGYTVSVFAIDVSPSMGDATADGLGGKKGKLDLVKEFVARSLEPKVSDEHPSTKHFSDNAWQITSGRKSEHVGILSFGGRTNNQANMDYVAQRPEDKAPPYRAISADAAIQTAKPVILETVMNLQVGNEQGNPVSALMVALDMIHTHKHSKAWTLEVVLITDGEAEFQQDEFEEAMSRLDEMGVKLVIIGIDFQPLDQTVDKTKTRNKRLAEKFWRTFYSNLLDAISASTSSLDFLPTFETFEHALESVRQPMPAKINGTVSGTFLYIGSTNVQEEEAIIIAIKYSKATMKARPPTLSKAWKPAMDLQAPMKVDPSSSQYRPPATNQLLASLAEHTEALPPNELASLISADVKNHSTYFIKRHETKDGDLLPTQPSMSFNMEGLEDDGDEQMSNAGKDEEEVVAKEDIVKAWRFGSTWVPMEADTFAPLASQKGVEILSFFPRRNIKRHHLMGEVRYIWPELKSPKAQIQFSSLVQAMHEKDMVAVVRWVLKDNGDPVVGMCVPQFAVTGLDQRIDYMFWVKLPFAEDEHNFWFPSLTKYKTTSGKVLEKHPLLPTEEQCELMDELVSSMDLDSVAAPMTNGEHAEDEDEDMDDKPELEPWFAPQKSFNPVIHRIKEAIFHCSITQDLDKDPLGPPHPELTKYFSPPAEFGEKVDSVTERLRSALDIKKVPPKTRKKVTKEGLREDEGYIDIDALFDETEGKDAATPVASSSKFPKEEQISPKKEKARAPHFIESDDEGTPPPRAAAQKPTPNKPKHGRLISNESPLEDFNRLIEGEGDVFRKAIQDLGQVVQENIRDSFSHQGFDEAIECLKGMRSTALMYEEVETYNQFVDELQMYVNDPKFKHRDFWKYFEKQGKDVEKISAEEAKEALEGYDE
ncbi:ATP-dependent DNA helicase 2 subunit 2, partial [Tremellales sp. Uapishka_1]